MCIDPAGIMREPGGLHEQWPSYTTMPTWANPVVVGSCAVMVTSMPPADPWAWCWVEGMCGAGEATCG